MSPALLALVACSGGDGTDPAPAPGTTQTVLTVPDAPWLDAPTTEEAVVDIAGIQAAVQDAVERLDSLDVDPIVALWNRAMADADPGCPYFYYTDDYDYWFDQCTASSGASYDGFGLDDVLLGIDLGDGLITDLITLGGVGTVTTADGASLETNNGYVQLVDSVSPDGLLTYTVTLVTGSFESDAPELDGTFIGEGLSVEAVITDYDFAGAKAKIIEGVLQNLPGEYPTVVFENAVLADPLTGATDCQAEPSGSASVQLPDGQWVDVIFDPSFDGETVTTADPSRCDGCGRAWHRTQELGEVCVDFGVWLQ